ncbi:orotate phosphoribosyltransferase [Aquimarina agarilytica]|uniref:orotate phosphoribosyltransferase n=1 Tax=Aquimarina agarilytica TaxID=1087449 RepID=UPI0002890E38|nr:orotate phosphoribosyltransferase [Aquimarina agarilytica]
MIFDIETAKETAAQLLQINAIKLQPQAPFTWASGWKSPIYCDNRISLSFPEVRNSIKNKFAAAIRKQYPNAEVIAGVATGAIGIGMLVADALDLPFIYIRPEAKKHGRQNQIEGIVPEGKNVVVIEDLISTGKSSLLAVEALKKCNANMLGMVAIFSYGFQIAADNFAAAEVTLHTLSNYENLIILAQEANYISTEEAETLQNWRTNPSEWGK